MSASLNLTPTEALVASQVTYWVRKALEGKGGKEDREGNRWSWLSASDLRGRLVRRYYTDITEHSLYRLLKSLVNKGWFVRAQLLYSSQRNSTYFYRFGPNHPAVCGEEQPVNPDPAEEQPAAEDLFQPGVSLLYTPSIASKDLSKNPSNGPSKAATAAATRTAVLTSSVEETAVEPANQQPPASRVDGTGHCVTPQGASAGKRAPLPRKGGKDAAQGRLGRVDELQRAVQRANARGFAVSKQPSAPKPQVETWVEGGYRWERKANGVLLKDPLETAPLR